MHIKVNIWIVTKFCWWYNLDSLLIALYNFTQVFNWTNVLEISLAKLIIKEQVQVAKCLIDISSKARKNIIEA